MEPYIYSGYQKSVVYNQPEAVYNLVMIQDLKLLENELVSLTPEERLQLARWLLDSVLNEPNRLSAESGNTLLAWAGRYNGGSGDTADQAEEILEREVSDIYGLAVDE